MINFEEISAIELVKLFRNSYKEANRTMHFKYEDEIKRRGPIKMLNALQWPILKTSIYKNRYTADEETLENMYYKALHSPGTFSLWMDHKISTLVQHWLPKDQWKPDECKSEHLPKNKLTGWI